MRSSAHISGGLRVASARGSSHRLDRLAKGKRNCHGRFFVPVRAVAYRRVATAVSQTLRTHSASDDAHIEQRALHEHTQSE